MPNHYKINKVPYPEDKFPAKPWEITKNGLPLMFCKRWLEARALIQKMIEEDKAYEAEKFLLDKKKKS